MQIINRVIVTLAFAATCCPAFATGQTQSQKSDAATVKAEHDEIGNGPTKTTPTHTMHPDAQWFPDAGLGLFIHWGIASVRAINISWPMRPGRALANVHLTPEERERVIRESDYNLNGKPLDITPNDYFSMAKDFNPKNYDPDKWLKAAKTAGFQYVVLTARHHEGFALWPSAFGDFNTKNWMGARDLIKDYVEAARRNGLKVGIYYSPPDWYFDRDYMNYLYGGGANKNPELPPLGPDLKPRTTEKTAEEKRKHEAEVARMVRGQIEELLTRYGKIDLIWFDGKPSIPNGDRVISQERIRELQPGIVINPRLHGKGDFVTYERNLNTDKVADGWAEFCNTWTNAWPHVAGAKFRAPGFVLGQFVKARSLGVNYLLGVGPMSNGEFTPEIYQNMEIVGKWMSINGESVHGTHPLAAAETASVPATTSGTARYLFLLPQFKDSGVYEHDILPPTDVTVTLKVAAKPRSVAMLGRSAKVDFEYSGGLLTVRVPASMRSRSVDVIRVGL